MSREIVVVCDSCGKQEFVSFIEDALGWITFYPENPEEQPLDFCSIDCFSENFDKEEKQTKKK